MPQEPSASLPVPDPSITMPPQRQHQVELDSVLPTEGTLEPLAQRGLEATPPLPGAEPAVSSGAPLWLLGLVGVAGALLAMLAVLLLVSGLLAAFFTF